MYCDSYVFCCLASIFDSDRLCFRLTTYDNINGPGGTIYVVIFGPAGLLMFPDQISRYRSFKIDAGVTGNNYYTNDGLNC